MPLVKTRCCRDCFGGLTEQSRGKGRNWSTLPLIVIVFECDIDKLVLFFVSGAATLVITCFVFHFPVRPTGGTTTEHPLLQE